MVFLLQADLKPFFKRKLALGPVLGCACCLILFGWLCSRFYLEGKGFTYLIEFGEREHARYLPQLRAVNHFELKDSAGYDAQWYAQIAMQPRLSDPALKGAVDQGAVDSLPYRARRILLSWTAYALAGGNAIWAMHIFSVQNIFCWFALAVLLWRWWPPNSWVNFFRWAAVLYSFGLCCSVRGSLTDGPSLLLIVCAAALVEAEKLWLAAAVLGIAGLARETNLLAGLMLIPPTYRFRRSGGTPVLLGLGAVAAAPLILWVTTLHFWIGPALDPGSRNMAIPFAGYLGKWREIYGVARTHGFDNIVEGDILVLIALTAQWLFIVLRPRWSELWWRIAAPYAVLAIFLGEAVWEGYPGATARVLLPLTAAFNFLVPLVAAPLRRGQSLGSHLVRHASPAGPRKQRGDRTAQTAHRPGNRRDRRRQLRRELGRSGKIAARILALEHRRRHDHVSQSAPLCRPGRHFVWTQIE